jgi:hypothetical protein
MNDPGKKIGVWTSKSRIFRFLGPFGGVFGDVGVQNRCFFSFFDAIATPLRGR